MPRFFLLMNTLLVRMSQAVMTSLTLILFEDELFQGDLHFFSKVPAGFRKNKVAACTDLSDSFRL